jgi:hypothetical protein
MRYRLRTLLILLAILPALIGVPVVMVREAYLAAVAITKRRMDEREKEAKALASQKVSPLP